MTAFGPADASLVQTMPLLPEPSHHRAGHVSVGSPALQQQQKQQQIPSKLIPARQQLLLDVFPNGIPPPNPSLPTIVPQRRFYRQGRLDGLMDEIKIPRSSPGYEVVMSDSNRFAALRGSTSPFTFDGILNVLERPWHYPFCTKRQMNGNHADMDVKAYACYLGDRRRNWGYDLDEMTSGRWTINEALGSPWAVRTENPSKLDDKGFWGDAWWHASLEGASTCTMEQRGKLVVRSGGSALAGRPTGPYRIPAPTGIIREVVVIADC